MKNLITISILLLVFASCKREKGCTDPTATNYNPNAEEFDGNCLYGSGKQVYFNFSAKYDGNLISANDFNQLKLTNEHGTTHSITKLRYLISNIKLHDHQGGVVAIDGYQLVDVTNSTGLSYLSPAEIPYDDYDSISFTFGFDTADNITGAYGDLNFTNWGWPDMLGGGYHNMQFEGRFIDSLGDTNSFAYHNGTARKYVNTVPVFENNSFRVGLTNNGDEFEIRKDKTQVVNITMDVAKWFKNPHTWNLNNLSQPLMPNYNAQKMMNTNGRDVFTMWVQSI